MDSAKKLLIEAWENHFGAAIKEDDGYLADDGIDVTINGKPVKVLIAVQAAKKKFGEDLFSEYFDLTLPFAPHDVDPEGHDFFHRQGGVLRAIYNVIITELTRLLCEASVVAGGLPSVGDSLWANVEEGLLDNELPATYAITKREFSMRGPMLQVAYTLTMEIG